MTNILRYDGSDGLNKQFPSEPFDGQYWVVSTHSDTLWWS